jgi:pyruvate dehydrogenase E2 component (dihydrolipoamide acetyltransferase)/2-oxoisovalerate dehydrogenase E2 component (dihydrolipoyl transacylase)
MELALPAIGEGVYEAEVVAWRVKPGDVVKRGQVLLEVLTDKATMEVPAPVPLTVTALRAQPGDTVKVGDVVLEYTTADQGAQVVQPVQTATSSVASAVVPRSVNGPVRRDARLGLPVKAAPSVRLMARKLGIDLGGIRGTGPEGRVLIEDLAPLVAPAEPNERLRPAEPRPDYGTPGTRIKFQGVRRRIAEQMERSKKTIPDYSYVDECDVTDLVKMREGLKDVYGRAGIKLTYLPFFVKAVVAALKEVPLVNASLDEQGGEIVLHDRYHIGIAVATPNGLLVPVVHDADQKDLATVAREIDQLSSAARSGQARLEDLRGSTFTLTSVGNIGGLFSTPVINPPEVGILGVGKIVRRPVYDDQGQIRPADIVYLSLTFDHRVIDGAVCAAFGNAVRRQLEAPAALLLPPKL